MRVKFSRIFQFPMILPRKGRVGALNSSHFHRHAPNIMARRIIDRPCGRPYERRPGGLRTGSPPSPPPRLIRPTVRLLPRSPRFLSPGPQQRPYQDDCGMPQAAAASIPHSDDVLEILMLLAGRQKVTATVKLADLRNTLASMVQHIDKLMDEIGRAH
jgi:hypothetical protein